MNRQPYTRTALILALVGALTLALSACGSSSGSAGSSATTITEAAGGGGSPIDVTLKDFSIDVAQTGSIAPGTYTFHVTNNGPSAHNLTINGPGVSNQATPTFGAGGTKDLTVTLKNGSYDLFCSVPGHKQAGMDTKLTVGSGGSGGNAAAAGGGSTSSNSGGSSSSGSSESGGGWS